MKECIDLAGDTDVNHQDLWQELIRLVAKEGVKQPTAPEVIELMKDFIRCAEVKRVEHDKQVEVINAIWKVHNKDARL